MKFLILFSIFGLSIVTNVSFNQSLLKIGGESLWLLPSLDLAIDTRTSSCRIFKMITIEDVKAKTPERFWRKLNFTCKNGCWEWGGFTNSKGYGRFFDKWINNGAFIVLTHRFIFEKTVSNIPPKMLILHKCDNRKCCNPNHLYMGDQFDNMKDMVNKQRQQRGETHSRAILKNADIPIIRNKIKSGESNAQIAQQYGVTSATIHALRIGLTWAHI